MDIISYLSTSYQASFNSPYSIETCRKILLDLSQRVYSEPSTRWAAFEAKKQESGNRIIDVYQESDTRYTFRIDYFSMTKSGRAKQPYAVTGVLESADNVSTHVTCESVYDKKEVREIIWTWIIATWMLVILFVVVFFDSTPTLKKMIAGFAILWTIAGWVIWSNYVYTKHHIIGEVQKWLDGQSSIPIVDHLGNLKSRRGYQFDFYIKDALAECVYRLTKSIQWEHYQYTSVGMAKGKALSDNYFIIIQQTTPTHYHFLITNDTHINHHQIVTEVVGELAHEDNVTHVRGCTTMKTSSDFKFIIAGVCILGGLVMWSKVGLIITLILLIVAIGILGITLWARLSECRNYLRNKLNTTPLYDFITEGNDVHFHSPYPIEDCVNMLMGYSPEFSEYSTPWGLGRKITRDNMRIILYEKDVNMRYFWIYSGETEVKARISRVVVKGRLETEGYGTQISYEVERWMNTYLHLAFLAILLMALLSILISPLITFLLTGCASVFAIVYVITWREMKAIREYAQFLLSGKANRKQKVADAK